MRTLNDYFLTAEIEDVSTASSTFVAVPDGGKIIKDGIIPDPATIGPDGQPLDPAAGAGGMDLGAPVMEPEIDGSPTEAPELPKGGEI